MDLADLGDTPILGSAPETSYGNMVLSIYRNAGLEPNIIFRSNVVPLLYEMVLNGVGAAMIPDSYYNPDDGICVYSLSPRIIVYQGIGLRSGYPLSEAEEYLIHLVTVSYTHLIAGTIKGFYGWQEAAFITEFPIRIVLDYRNIVCG